jgi:hypothetical protein
MAPKDAVAAYNVAVSLYNERFFSEAIFWYEETLRRDPKISGLQEIINTIAELRKR